MDVLPLPNVDVVHDMMRTPWPIASESVDTVLAAHVLEHVPHHHPSGRDGLLVVMEEIARVLRPGGECIVKAPHFLDREACEADPTHTRTIFPRTWRHFANDSDVPTFYSTARFSLASWRTSGVAILGWDRWKVGKWGITVHLHRYLPFLRWLLERPSEAEYVLRKSALRNS